LFGVVWGFVLKAREGGDAQGRSCNFREEEHVRTETARKMEGASAKKLARCKGGGVPYVQEIGGRKTGKGSIAKRGK